MISICFQITFIVFDIFGTKPRVKCSHQLRLQKDRENFSILLRRLIESEKLRNDMGKKGADMVKIKFSKENMIESFTQILD